MVEQPSAAQYTEDQRDCLQEICNIATGQTADVLARKLDAFVTLPIPEIKIIDADNLAHTLRCFEAGDRVYCAGQHFSDSGGDQPINGFALVLLSEHCLAGLTEGSGAPKSHTMIAKEICQPMATACLKALSEQGELLLRCDTPAFISVETLDTICRAQSQGWRKVLLVEIHFQLEEDEFEGDLLLLFPDQAIITMAQKLDELLDY